MPQVLVQIPYLVVPTRPVIVSNVDSPGTRCTRHPQTVREVDEVSRLTTPAVVEKTQDHFGCLSEDDYGGPIDTSVRNTVQVLKTHAAHCKIS